MHNARQGHRPTLPLAIVLALLLAAPSLAQIYKWTDENGKVHYSDKPTGGREQETLDVEVNSYEHVSHEAVNTDPPHKPEQVVMYATSWCGYCKKARNYFRANGIDYIEYDIEQNRRAKQRYDALGGRGVPVILVGKRRMNGFSVAGFERIYKP